MIRSSVLGNEALENRNSEHSNSYEEMVELPRLDSAAGSAKQARNVHKQAVYPMRGKILNTHSKELADMIKNQEIKDILLGLGCGIGDKFNIKNLRYDKIIFMADADADGGHINCLLTTLFLTHLPELILAGKVYCAVPPLYRVTRNKESFYVYNPSEIDQYIGTYTIQRFKGLGEMDYHELWDSTMNPDTRMLIQLTTNNLEQVQSLYDILMGRNSADRKKFILEHAKEYNMTNEDSDFALEGE